jgi:hypothetical protein
MTPAARLLATLPALPFMRRYRYQPFHRREPGHGAAP